MVYQYISFVLGLVFSILYYASTAIDSIPLLIPILVVSFFILLYYINGYRNEYSVYSNWIRPSNLLLVGLIVVNFQTFANVALNLASISDYLNTSLYSGYVGKVFFLSSSCLLGIMAGLSTKPHIFMFKTSAEPVIEKEVKFWSILSFVLLCAFIVNIDINSFLTGLDYEGSGASDRIIKKSSYFEQLLNCSVVVVLALQSRRLAQSNEPVELKTFLASYSPMFKLTIFVYILLRLLSGDRGPVIYTICAIVFSYWIISRKKVSFIKFASFVLCAAICVTALGIVRGLDKELSFADRVADAQGIMSKNELRSVCKPTQELANSVNCNFIAVHDINEGVTSYKYGAYNFIALIGSIPGSSFVLSKVFGVNLHDYMSSEYLTISYFGKNYPFGLGTTAVADFYLDFGALVSFLLFFFCGVIYKKIDYMYTIQPLRKASIPMIIFIIKISSIAIYTSRFSFAGTMASALYIIIIYYVIHKLLFCIR